VSGETGAAALEAWIRAKVSEQLGVTPDEVDVNLELNRLGVDSVQMVVLVGELGRHVGKKLKVGVLWDHPTIAALAAHVAGLAEESPR
jgi:aryl carrier-like protein